LSIGLQQLKQDMRYRVKVVDLSEKRNSLGKRKIKTIDNENENEENNDSSMIMMQQSSSTSNEDTQFLIQNWQFEIRKLTYEDAGTYTCLLPLVKPITKNITLQVIRKDIQKHSFIFFFFILRVIIFSKKYKADLVIEPKEANFRVDDKIVIKCKATLRTYTHNANNKNMNHNHRSTNNAAYTLTNGSFLNNNNHHHHQRHQRMHKPNIYWYKGNEILKDTDTHRNKLRHEPSLKEINKDLVDNRKIEIETNHDFGDNLLNSVLTISNAKVNDSGKYRCIYDNIQEQVTVHVSQPECKFILHFHNSYMPKTILKRVLKT
jgi:hypothetical protein